MSDKFMEGEGDRNKPKVLFEEPESYDFGKPIRSVTFPHHTGKSANKGNDEKTEARASQNKDQRSKASEPGSNTGDNLENDPDGNEKRTASADDKYEAAHEWDKIRNLSRAKNAFKPNGK